MNEEYIFAVRECEWRNAMCTFEFSVFKQVIICFSVVCIQSDRSYTTWGLNPVGKRNRANITQEVRIHQTNVSRECGSFCFCRLHISMYILCNCPSFKMSLLRSRFSHQFRTIVGIRLGGNRWIVHCCRSLLWCARCVVYVCVCVWRLYSLIPRDWFNLIWHCMDLSI